MSTYRDIRRRIEQELLWHESIDGRHIKVRLDQHVVTLHGWVPTSAQKVAAQRVTQRVADGESVVTELVVRPTEPIATNDADLANAMSFVLHWLSGVPPNAVRAVVEHGCVTLHGKVDSDSQRAAAEAAANRMRGVVDVNNRITLHDHPVRSDLCGRIYATLSRCGLAATSKIRVEDRDGVVRLIGTVGTITEREAASKAAWMTHGVKWVVEQLDVM
ncbi:BON domain-containing protein [Paraburkholderia sp. J8-2]|uniref:BON domain-containing protein n=1 Tax=Paraburkholderia sp. J8-2 TaxID=2805440 RepID=UPI002AB66C8A|nr:BON domain-containing protein [Paraburkholderia sp. J8-2]